MPAAKAFAVCRTIPRGPVSRRTAVPSCPHPMVAAPPPQLPPTQRYPGTGPAGTASTTGVGIGGGTTTGAGATNTGAGTGIPKLIPTLTPARTLVIPRAARARIAIAFFMAARRCRGAIPFSPQGPHGAAGPPECVCSRTLLLAKARVFGPVFRCFAPGRSRCRLNQESTPLAPSVHAGKVGTMSVNLLETPGLRSYGILGPHRLFVKAGDTARGKSKERIQTLGKGGGPTQRGQAGARKETHRRAKKWRRPVHLIHLPKTTRIDDLCGLRKGTCRIGLLARGDMLRQLDPCFSR